MKFKYKVLIAVPLIILLLDQLTKWLIRSKLYMGQIIPVIPGYFDIVHISNRGAAFGMFSGMSSSFREPFFFIVSAVAVIVIFFVIKNLQADEKLLAVTLSLILGGVFGNILDRIRFGEVTDFLSVHLLDKMADFTILGKYFSFRLEWPAFNVADSAITIAMILLMWSVVRPQKKDV